MALDRAKVPSHGYSTSLFVCTYYESSAPIPFICPTVASKNNKNIHKIVYVILIIEPIFGYLSTVPSHLSG